MKGESIIGYDINFTCKTKIAIAWSCSADDHSGMRQINVRERNGEALFSTFIMTKHAVLRMAQRNISVHDLEYVLEHGERINVTGVIGYMLRRRDILPGDRNKSEITRLEGSVVLTGFSEDGTLEIITAYRNKSAFKELRSKPKYDNRKSYRTDRNPSLLE